MGVCSLPPPPPNFCYRYWVLLDERTNNLLSLVLCFIESRSLHNVYFVNENENCVEGINGLSLSHRAPLFSSCSLSFFALILNILVMKWKFRMTVFHSSHSWIEFQIFILLLKNKLLQMLLLLLCWGTTLGSQGSNGELGWSRKERKKDNYSDGT